jgi:hypothetical protein
MDTNHSAVCTRRIVDAILGSAITLCSLRQSLQLSLCRSIPLSLPTKRTSISRSHCVILILFPLCCSLEASNASLLTKLQETEAALTQSQATVDSLKQQLDEAQTENAR